MKPTLKEVRKYCREKWGPQWFEPKDEKKTRKAEARKFLQKNPSRKRQRQHQRQSPKKKSRMSKSHAKVYHRRIVTPSEDFDESMPILLQLANNTLYGLRYQDFCVQNAQGGGIQGVTGTDCEYTYIHDTLQAFHKTHVKGVVSVDNWTSAFWKINEDSLFIMKDCWTSLEKADIQYALDNYQDIYVLQQ